MTVLEWLKKKTRYSFEEGNFEVIALEECFGIADDVCVHYFFFIKN